jgi:hypothetical protein
MRIISLFSLAVLFVLLESPAILAFRGRGIGRARPHARVLASMPFDEDLRTTLMKGLKAIDALQVDVRDLKAELKTFMDYQLAWNAELETFMHNQLAWNAELETFKHNQSAWNAEQGKFFREQRAYGTNE